MISSLLENIITIRILVPKKNYIIHHPKVDIKGELNVTFDIYVVEVLAD